MKKLITLLLISVFGVQAHASLTISKMDMENRMRDRVQEIATKADPTAFAQVAIKLRKIRSNLSFLGLETHVTPLENGQDIGPESIESIDIKVLSRLEPFPEWLKNEIAATTGMEGIKVNVVYAKPDTPLKDVTSQLTEFFTEELYVTLNDSFANMKWAMWVLGVLFVAGFALIGWTLFSFANKLENTLQKVIAENLVPMATALGQMAGGTNKAAAIPTAKKDSGDGQPSRVTVDASSKNQFEQFSVPALAALFIDCYWTKMDGYAHYLWSQLNPQQREGLMKSEAVDPDYFSHIIGVPARPEDYHSHAWYMNPHEKFNKTDQKALGDWLKKNLDSSHMVSPLRLDYVELSLEERLKISANAKKVNADTKSLPVSPPRVFAPKLRLASLSPADELFLFKNYSKIQLEARTQLKTLVWLAVAPIESRRKVLDQLDARQLAEAWSAPKEVLEELKKGLSAKKIEMLEHFLKTNEASRNSEVFAYLVDAGLEASQAPAPPAPNMKAA
jgi:hypothetical protein